ncbi:unnamed protein product, partial [Allacma fusca]
LVFTLKERQIQSPIAATSGVVVLHSFTVVIGLCSGSWDKIRSFNSRVHFSI